MSAKTKKIIKILFGISVIFISFYYLHSLIKTNPEAIFKTLNATPPIILLAIVFLSTLGGLFNAFIWHQINLSYNDDTKFTTSYWAWSVSRVFRYIPGKVASFVVRHKLQESKLSTGVKSSINEFALTLLPISLISSASLFLEGNEYYLLGTLFIAVFIALIFARKLLQHFENFASKKIKIKKLSSGIFNTEQMLKIGSQGLIPVLLHGSAFYILLVYGYGQVDAKLLTTIAVFYLSGIIGQISLIAPAGIGVREAALAFMMTAQGADTQIALASAIVSRLILFVSEIINLLLANIIRNKRQ